MFAIIWGVLFVLAQFVDVLADPGAGLLLFTVIPALLSGFAVYVTRPSGRCKAECWPGWQSYHRCGSGNRWRVRNS